MSKTAGFLRFYMLGGNPFERNEVRVSNADVFFANLVGPAVTLSPCSALCVKVFYLAEAFMCKSVFV